MGRGARAFFCVCDVDAGVDDVYDDEEVWVMDCLLMRNRSLSDRPSSRP